MTIEKVLKMCHANGFLNLVNEGVLKVGPVGALLHENLRNEWFFSNVTNRDVSVFMNGSNVVDAVQFAKEMCLQQLPFGVAEFVEIGHDENDGFEKYFACEKGLALRCRMFVSPSNSTQFFHQWQRQRRMWWRKFSALPGRYTLTDIKTDQDGSQGVAIHAKYAWGEQLVETLDVKTKLEETADSFELLSTKDGRKKVQAHCVTNCIKLSVMFLNTLCDAYDENNFQAKPHPLLRLHRKLAPYKISFAIYSAKKETLQELQQLALYLCKQMRANHISSLLTPIAWKNGLELQWNQYDQLGVPYNVLLNENTLKNGISLLRSRDTTLKEQVHVTDLANYVEQIFKNY